MGEEAQKSVIQRIFQQVAQRPDSFCNYLEGIIPEWGEGTKLIYRHYATLYFVFAVDAQESDLGILDLVQGENIQTWFVCDDFPSIPSSTLPAATSYYSQVVL